MCKIGDVFYLDKDYDNKVDFCNSQNCRIVEIDPDETGRRFQIQSQPEPTEEELQEQLRCQLKEELVRVMEDVAQEQLGIVRDDYSEKRHRAAELINQLRIIEGKAAREVLDIK